MRDSLQSSQAGAWTRFTIDCCEDTATTRQAVSFSDQDLCSTRFHCRVGMAPISPTCSNNFVISVFKLLRFRTLFGCGNMVIQRLEAPCCKSSKAACHTCIWYWKFLKNSWTIDSPQNSNSVQIVRTEGSFFTPAKKSVLLQKMDQGTNQYPRQKETASWKTRFIPLQ